MCGIVGYTGNSKARSILINGLSKLEYRGYDSAGISTIENNKIVCLKHKGRVKELENMEGVSSLNGTIGIAHTRWATHGKPSSTNAHPHLDNSGTFSVVHNGIIENYNELKVLLSNSGYNFISETDTEVIPNLIHYYYNKENSNPSTRFAEAVRKATLDLKGSYAIAVICSLEPDKIIVARKDSPLVIGVAEDEKYIASDIPAILEYTNNIYILNDGDLAELSNKSVTFYDEGFNVIQKKPEVITWNAKAASKNGYDNFMLKEIYEQPTAIRETIGTRLSKDGKCEFSDINITKEYLSEISRIYIVACGTAMHAGLAVKPIFERLVSIPVEVDTSSEFRYRKPLIDKKTLIICISQSGETADTLAALKLSKVNRLQNYCCI